TGENAVARDTLSFSVGMEYRTSWGAVNSSVAVGAAVARIQQSLVDRSGDGRLDDVAWGFGPSAHLGVELPLTWRLGGTSELSTLTTFFAENDGARTKRHASGETAFHVASGMMLAF